MSSKQLISGKELGLEDLIALHTNKKERLRHYSSQLTFCLALISLLFFGTLISYHSTKTTLNQITGMAVAVGESSAVQNIVHIISTDTDAAGDFVMDVRTSPNLVQIKLFFYTLWILVVLVGSAVWYEL